MAELLTEDIIIEKLEADGFMQEPDGPWLLEHMEEQYGGNLDNASDWIDNRNTLKIYSVLMTRDLMYQKTVITMKITNLGLRELLMN